MISPAVTIATKGILNNNGVVLPCSGLLILNVEVGRITRKKGGSSYSTNIPLGYPLPKDPEKKYYVKITFQIGEQIFTDVKYINNDIKITTNDINIEIIDDKPIVKISFLDFSMQLYFT